MRGSATLQRDCREHTFGAPNRFAGAGNSLSIVRSETPNTQSQMMEFALNPALARLIPDPRLKMGRQNRSEDDDHETFSTLQSMQEVWFTLRKAMIRLNHGQPVGKRKVRQPPQRLAGR